MFQTNVVEKTKCVQSLFAENRAVFEIMWKNIVELERPQMTVWRMRISC